MSPRRAAGKRGRSRPRRRREAAAGPSDPAPTAADRPTSRVGPRLELPPSGLASDILRTLEAVPELPVETLAVPEHSASFFTTPAREERRAPEPQEHLATFFLDREEYGLEVRLVQEIIRAGDVRPVPRAAPFVEGVINLRGRIVPVLDLKRKLGLGSVQRSRHARIVVVRVGDRSIGLMVDSASQVLKVPVSNIEPPPPEVAGGGANYIRGVAKPQSGLIILIDLEKALAAELSDARGSA